MYEKKKHEYWAGQQLLVDFPGGPVVGSPPANAGGAQVRSLVQEDSPSCRGATRLVHTTTEASTPRACAQQQVKSLQ